MHKFLVCKTVVAYGQGTTRYALFFPVDGFNRFGSLGELADYLRQQTGIAERVVVKNEAPVDIIWHRDDTLPDRVEEFERLSKNEVAELARLLRR